MIKHNIFTEQERMQLPADQPVLLFISECKDETSHMMHAHKETLEVLLLAEGSLMNAIEYRHFHGQAGDIFVHNSNTVHDEHPCPDTPYHTYCLGITNLQLPGLAPNQLLPENISALFRSPAQYEELKYLMTRMLFHASKKKTYYQEICQSLMTSILMLLRQMVADRIDHFSLEDNTLCTQVEKYIAAHYAKDLTLELLGNTFHISPYHLSHIFKKETGHSPKQYILRRRIGEAQSLLVDTNIAIGEVARLVGFEDSGHFSKIFYKHVGMRPTEYRSFRTTKPKS